MGGMIIPGLFESPIRSSSATYGVLTKSWTEYIQKGDLEMYSDEQYRKVNIPDVISH